MAKISIETHLSQHLKDRFQRATARNGQSMAEVSRQLIIDYCNQQDLLNSKLDWCKA